MCGHRQDTGWKARQGLEERKGSSPEKLAEGACISHQVPRNRSLERAF